MTGQAAKAGFTFNVSRINWRALMRGSLLLLLFTHQSWAGIVCHCALQGSAQNDSQHQCHHAAHLSKSTLGTEQEVLADHHSTSCSGESTAIPNGGIETSPQGATVCCCHATPSAEVQAVSVLSQSDVPGDSTPPLISFGALRTSTSEYIGLHQPLHSRPLYLTLSSFLI